MRLSHFLQVILLLFFAVPALAQSPADARARTASIAGRVTIGGAPAVNATITIQERQRERTAAAQGGPIRPQIYSKVRTDGAGRYRATGLAEGVYFVTALSRAFVTKSTEFEDEPEREIMVEAGEARENVDFEFIRGSVITGRVTDAEGRPLIAGTMQLLPVNEQGESQENFPIDISEILETDDRGVYRLYGLRAGRYLLGVGADPWFSPSSGRLPVTYYPETTNRAQARAIELKAGETIEGIDIRLAPPRATYEAFGRVIDAETGRPLAGQSIVSEGAQHEPNAVQLPSQSAISDKEGRFKMTGLISGEYHLSISEDWAGPGEYYNETTTFRVEDGNVDGLEIKALRGAVVSGVVAAIPGAEAAVKQNLRQIILSAIVWGEPQARDAGDGAAAVIGQSIARTNADGSFRLNKLLPGWLSFRLTQPGQQRYIISRIERDGAPVEQRIEIRRQEQIKNLRIWIEPANSRIHGEVKIAGGVLPPNMRFLVRARRVDTSDPMEERIFTASRTGPNPVDEKGRFQFEQLAPGTYEFTLTVFVKNAPVQGETAVEATEARQTVVLTKGGEARVTLSFDPANRKLEGRQ
ncbi:MAG: carboxypeptidase regulatory-like domain-containing protein [Blastocatellia bacterium]|nr:carboxypeptidase regulatory-like domain-containing protein [Blastocatellia bacterium]